MPNSLQNASELLSQLADPTRLRLLALLAEHELSVAELTRILCLPQSRVSTHLGRLRDAGFLRDRRVGASTLYAFSEASLLADARQVWLALRATLSDAILTGDEARCCAMLKAREGETWVDSVAGQMERHYSPGRTWEAAARGFVGLLELGDVLEVGSGDGVVAELLAGQARSITCLDQNERAIRAARSRLSHHPHVAFVVADMHEMPFPSGAFDQVLLLNVLTYATDPRLVLAEATRVLRPSGRLAVVTIRAHGHHEVLETYGHRNLGFEPESLAELIEDTGLELVSCRVTSRESKPPHHEVISAFAVRRDNAVVRPSSRFAPVHPPTSP